MYKTTIQLERLENSYQGENLLGHYDKWSEQKILDTLVEWSSKERYDYSNPVRDIYKFFLRREEENVSENRRKYFHEGKGKEITKEFFSMLYNALSDSSDLYCFYGCDVVYYLDIYWQ